MCDYNSIQTVSFPQKQMKIVKESQPKTNFQIRRIPVQRIFPAKGINYRVIDPHGLMANQRNKLHSQKNQRVSHNFFKNVPGHKATDIQTRPDKDDFEKQIYSSKVYKDLSNIYLQQKALFTSQKTQLQKEISGLQKELEKKNNQNTRLSNMRDNFQAEVQEKRELLLQHRQKNYGLRWTIYRQRGYQFYEPTYEELLELEEQMGYVSRGLTGEQIQLLGKVPFSEYKRQRNQRMGKLNEHEQSQEQQICCICFDCIQDRDIVTVLQCQHPHHCDCIKDWLLTQKCCPICKQEVFVVEPLEEKKELDTEKKSADQQNPQMQNNSKPEQNTAEPSINQKETQNRE